MTGPCLCGDPYCGSCGNPALAELEALGEGLLDAMHANNASREHYEILIAVIPEFIKAVDIAISGVVRDVTADDRQYMDYLKGENERLGRMYKKVVDVLEENFETSEV